MVPNHASVRSAGSGRGVDAVSSRSNTIAVEQPEQRVEQRVHHRVVREAERRPVVRPQREQPGDRSREHHRRAR